MISKNQKKKILNFPPFICKQNQDCTPSFVKVGKNPSFYFFHYYLAHEKMCKKMYIQENKEHPGIFQNPEQDELAFMVQKHKERARNIFKLYKKKECERKRRYKKKEKSCIKTTTNFFLNRCGICRRLRVGVNIFWGEILCDLCYFTPERILFIMNRRYIDIPPIPTTPTTAPNESENVMMIADNFDLEKATLFTPPEIDDGGGVEEKNDEESDVNLEELVCPISSSSSSTSSSSMYHEFDEALINLFS